jgi:hypothetical protein
MGIPSRAVRVEAEKKPDEEVRDTSNPQPAQQVLRAPRPKSWSPPLPPHRIPVPPPPLPHQQAVQPKPSLPAPALPSPDLHRSAQLPLRSQIVPVMQPARPPPPKFAPMPAVIPSQEDHSDSSLNADDMALRRGSSVGWPAVAMLTVAAIAVVVFAVAQLRPDITANVLDLVRGPSTAQASALGAGSTPVMASVTAAGPRAAPIPRSGGGTALGANPELPVVSVWSLPVARSGQPQPPAPVPHGSPLAAAAAAPPQQHGLFVPSAAFAFNFNAAPQASPAPNVASTPNVAPTPDETPAPVQRPAPLAAKAAPAVDDAPPANVAAPPPAAPPPPPAAAPPPPPKPKFAPGSLEDQIQKAVEAEAAKKK